MVDMFILQDTINVFSWFTCSIYSMLFFRIFTGKHSLHKFEVAQITNLCPESAEEVIFSNFINNNFRRKRFFP